MIKFKFVGEFLYFIPTKRVTAFKGTDRLNNPFEFEIKGKK